MIVLGFLYSCFTSMNLNFCCLLIKEKFKFITQRSHQFYLFTVKDKKQKQMQKHFKQQSRLWDYAILKKLGQGTSGQVFQVLNKNNQQVYALKKMTISGTQQKQKIQAFKQIKCLSLLSHPSIIEYNQSFLSMDNIYIVMEYASKGDFSQIIEERRKKQKFYTEEQLWKLFEQIIKGVKYLHEKSIIHRDLKLENIFMTQGGQLKIGDLGMAKILSKEDQLISTRVGTLVYFAPQMIQNQLYSFPVDIWSLGCVLYYLTTLQHPFQQATIQTLAYYAIQKGPKPIKGQYSIQLINFISDCLQKDVKTRPNIFQLALRLKNRNQPLNQRYNKVSIFNISHLNRILTASAEHKISAKSERKINTQRGDYSMVLRSPRKIYTSLNQRAKFDGEMNAVETRNIRSSADSRNFVFNKYFIDSPQSPTLNPKLKKRLSHNQTQQTYRGKKLVGDDLQDNFHSPFIKTNGFSLQMIQKKQSPQKFYDPQSMQGFDEKPLLVKKAFSRRSHR